MSTARIRISLTPESAKRSRSYIWFGIQKESDLFPRFFLKLFLPYFLWFFLRLFFRFFLWFFLWFFLRFFLQFFLWFFLRRFSGRFAIIIRPDRRILGILGGSISSEGRRKWPDWNLLGIGAGPDSPGTIDINRSFGIQATNPRKNVKTISNFIAEPKWIYLELVHL